MLVSVSLTGGVAETGQLSSIALSSGNAVERDEFAAYEAVKRVVDILGASSLLVLLSPVLALSAVLVRLSSVGPVIFCQNRITEGGKIFTIYKFRTMRADAESESGAVWALEGDPRITTIGKFLRLTRLDELPQLINVLLGDMSLVGPRPERPEIAELLSHELISFKRRTMVRAGITGLAQVSSGYASSIEEYRRKLALDILYVNNRSLLLDAKILAKTLLVVLTGSGAR